MKFRFMRPSKYEGRSHAAGDVIDVHEDQADDLKARCIVQHVPWLEEGGKAKADGGSSSAKGAPGKDPAKNPAGKSGGSSKAK